MPSYEWSGSGHQGTALGHGKNEVHNIVSEARSVHGILSLLSRLFQPSKEQASTSRSVSSLSIHRQQLSSARHIKSKDSLNSNNSPRSTRTRLTDRQNSTNLPFRDVFGHRQHPPRLRPAERPLNLSSITNNARSQVQGIISKKRTQSSQN